MLNKEQSINKLLKQYNSLTIKKKGNEALKIRRALRTLDYYLSKHKANRLLETPISKKEGKS